MRQTRFRTTLLILFGIGLGLAISALLVCWSQDIWSQRDFRARQKIHNFPPGEALWSGGVRAGDDLDAFREAYPPHESETIGSYTHLTYYSEWPLAPDILRGMCPSLDVIAKDGRLVEAVAGDDTWYKVFFKMDPAVEAEFWHLRDLKHKRQREEWQKANSIKEASQEPRGFLEGGEIP